jgi:hypothetical protein
MSNQSVRAGARVLRRLACSGVARASLSELDLRVADEESKFYIVDAHVEGVWLAEALRDDFQGFLKEHNGDISALTAHLRELAAMLKGT